MVKKINVNIEVDKLTSVKPVLYKSFTDNETGEVMDIPLMFHDLNSKTGINNNFEMIFYGHMMQIINDLGNKKIRILKYLVDKRDKYNNTVLKTVREISEELGFSSKTVNDTLIFLQDKGAIKRKTGVIFLDADLICDGRFKGKIMHIYNSVESETQEERNARLEREIKRKLAEAEKLKGLIVEIPAENQTKINFGLSH